MRDCLQLNTERTVLRREPEKILSIVPPFDEHKFNFNKINPCEILFECQNGLNGCNGNVTFLINNSPLTKYHSLICPSLSDNLPQVLAKDAISFAIDVIYGFNDRNFRIGFNSPGAFASVNHLHMHLMHIDKELYVETAVCALILII